MGSWYVLSVVPIGVDILYEDQRSGWNYFLGHIGTYITDTPPKSSSITQANLYLTIIIRLSPTETASRFSGLPLFYLVLSALPVVISSIRKTTATPPPEIFHRD